MLKTFFLIALRNISRNKGFTFINVVGLATGLAASLLILLWIQDELSYDKFNVNGENIYRVEEDQFYSGERYHVTVTPHPAGPVWKEKIPEIIEQTRVNRLGRMLFRVDEKVFFETSVVGADSGLFRMFTIPFLYGDKDDALRDPHSIVISESLAAKYFGSENPVGKTITMENNYQLMVTGVFKEIPKNSVLTFTAVLPYSFMSEIGSINNSWGSNSIFTYVHLGQGVNIASVDKKLTDVVLENNPETTTKFLLFPFLDIHLHSQFGYETNRGPVTTLYIFTLIAVFVLLIACFNFINLTTARASSRSKEIGIKKVVGADRSTMIFQFMSESLMLVAVALLISLLLCGLFLNIFNGVSGKNFSLNDLFEFRFIVSFLIVGLVAGLISGIYPALYLSSVKPVDVLKGDRVSGNGGLRLRQVLVVIQFTLSILIATSAVFLYLQFKLLQDKDLGFNKNNLISIPMAEGMKSKYYSLKEELLKETLVQGVTASLSNPVRMGSNSGGADWEGRDPETRVLIGTNGVDYDYIKTMEMKLVTGRDFSREFQSDMVRDTTGNFLINEEVAKIMGTDDPVGKPFRFMGLNGRIVGVMKNFNFHGADQPIEPMAFALADTRYLSFILIRLTPGNLEESLKSVERIWNEQILDYPLDFTYVDQDYENLYRSQIRLTSLLKYFTILAVIIACLGLYGLSSYSAARRTNEIGIRKVMGASSLDVMYSMSKEFLLLVLISISISIPVGWIVVERLLGEFAVRIDINPFIFAVIAAVSLIVALFTLSFQAFRAAGINPADALKVE